MMASYVQITFDRTSPEIEIYAPRYTTNEIVNIITVEANEPLSTHQEFYVEDGQGGIHNYTFIQSEPHIFTGRIRFNDNVPYGILKIFARVRDEVDNESNLVMATIELKESIRLLTMTESHRERFIVCSERVQRVENEEHEADVISIEKARSIKITERTRFIETKDSKVKIDS